VIILPSAAAAEAPVVLRSGEEGVALLQPAEPAAAAALALDTISYPSGGAVAITGRGRPGATVRLYVNALHAGEVAVGADGRWQASLPPEPARAARLLRFDAVDASGQVTGRLEAPFRYEAGAGPQRLAERRVEIARGDNLWRIAERAYGEGLRYSVIYQANSDLIRDPDLIYPGQVFSVPDLVDAD